MSLHPGRDEARCVWSARALLGEGPVWAETEQALYWLDIKGGRVHRFEPAAQARQRVDKANPQIAGDAKAGVVV